MIIPTDQIEPKCDCRTFRALDRIKRNIYLEDDWEDDKEDSVRKIYRFLIEDIDLPDNESLLEDKALVIENMIEDVRAYRNYILEQQEKNLDS